MYKFNLKLISNGKTLDISNNSLYKLESIEGIDSAELELNTINNASYDGMIIANKRIKSRPINFKVDYMGTNKEERRREIIKFFNLKSSGILIIEYGDITRAIEYHIENFSCPLVNIHNKLSFTVDLICVQPYLREVEDIKVDIATWLGKFTFPLIIPEDEGIIMGLRQPLNYVRIANNGDIETGLIIKIKALGEVVNPRITNETTTDFIEVKKTMSAGEEITINTNIGEKKVISSLNGIDTNIMGKLNPLSVFLTLPVGTTLYSYKAESGADMLEISIYYNPCYMGV